MVDLAIDTFKSKLTGGGARSNLYRVTVNFPSYAEGDSELASFMIKNASFPSSTTEAAEVFFRGRVIPLEGDRTYEPITLTIYNDVDHPIRKSFVRWKDEMSNHTGNKGLSNPADYMTDIKIEQLSKSGDITATYDIIGAWPLTVGNIELGHETMNTVQEFTVDLRYLYWKQDGVTQ